MIDFEVLWKAYPKKQKKTEAKRAFDKLIKNGLLDDELFTTMLQAIEKQQRSKQWRDGYIPKLTNWLKDASWEEDLPEDTRPIEYEPNRVEGNTLAERLKERYGVEG